MISQHKKKVVECISFQKQESLCNVPLLHNQVLKPFSKFDVFSSHKSITNNGGGVVLGVKPLHAHTCKANKYSMAKLHFWP